MFEVYLLFMLVVLNTTLRRYLFTLFDFYGFFIPDIRLMVILTRISKAQYTAIGPINHCLFYLKYITQISWRGEFNIYIYGQLYYCLLQDNLK